MWLRIALFGVIVQRIVLISYLLSNYHFSLLDNPEERSSYTQVLLNS